MRSHHMRLTILLVVTLSAARASAQPITAAGQPAQLDVRAAGERSIRITLTPVSFNEPFPVNPAVVDRSYPDDVRARGLGSQFMWGRDLLVAPVFTTGATSREVYLPKGDWYDWWTNERAAGGQTVTRQVDLSTMPLYVRAGAIVPFDPVRQYTAQAVTEPTTPKIYTGADGTYTLYVDDGISQEYVAARGTWIRMTWNDRARQLTLEPGAPKGATNLATKRTFRVRLLPVGTTKDISYEGKRFEIRF